MTSILLLDVEKLLKEALAQHLDPHTYVAAKLRGVEMSEVAPAERRLVKQLNYVYLYSNRRSFKETLNGTAS